MSRSQREIDPGIIPDSMVESAAHRAYGRRLPREPGQFPDLVDRFDPRAVRPEELLQAELLQFARGPGEMVIRGLVQMKSADRGVDGRIADLRPRVLERIDDAGVAAAGDHDESFGRINHERLILRQIVLSQACHRRRVS